MTRPRNGEHLLPPPGHDEAVEEAQDEGQLEVNGGFLWWW